MFPESCTLVENEFVKRKDIRKSVIDHFLMYYVYDTDSSAIIVLRLVYGRRDLNEILKSM